jgi:hypothetical protein
MDIIHNPAHNTREQIHYHDRRRRKKKIEKYIVYIYGQPVFLIRIRIDFGRLDPDPHRECGSGSRRAKMTHKNRKREEMLSFLVLDVLF